MSPKTHLSSSTTHFRGELGNYAHSMRQLRLAGAKLAINWIINFNTMCISNRIYLRK